MPSYTELHDAQRPAAQLLARLGWTPLSPEQTLTGRGGLLSNVLLEGILEERLRAINRFTYKGGSYRFSDGAIHAAIHALKHLPDSGLVSTSEKAFDLIQLGRSFEETVQGDRKSFTVRYVDWEHPENNHYHLAEEFEVEGPRATRRPDLVLFVNGIPMAVIEAKRRDKKASIEEAISQHIRNQGREEGAPRLYHYAQLLLALHPNEAKYATTGTPAPFWAVWNSADEAEDVEAAVAPFCTGPRGGARLPTAADRALWCLARPARVLDLARRFVVYDGKDKKIARYQQFFAVKNAVARVKEVDADGRRKGGVIWHTQGSGKSLTMVMLAKSLALDAEIKSPRVVIVTDRVDLDDQIWRTFTACGKEPVRATSGAHLGALIEDNSVEVITTVIDKFDTALHKRAFRNEGDNIFVLVDESHRSQYGATHAKMRRALPRASYIGFTGTPLLKEEKSTAQKFGGFIHTYSIRRAVDDRAVVPLLYEGRAAKLSVARATLDRAFDRLTEPLTDYERKALKARHARITAVYKSRQVVEEIAYDIAKHWTENWAGRGFKAMLAVPLKSTAVQYLKAFEELAASGGKRVAARVVISAPDTREDHSAVDEEPDSEVQKWWLKAVAGYPGGREKYKEHTIARFNAADDEVELLIVVGKLLTGFDAPRCTVLYIAKPLAEHNLLQAIARVNRLFAGKDYGHIIDYVGIMGELDRAMTEYEALSGFDVADLEGALANVRTEIEDLPQHHAALLDVFKGLPDLRDTEAIERFLSPEDRRKTFVEKLTRFGRCLQTSLSSDEIYRLMDERRIGYFLSEFRFYNSLRVSVAHRYHQALDYKAYESRVRALLDTHVGTEGMDVIAAPVDIFNEAAFKEEVERVTGTAASKADAIAYRMKKTVTERMDEDPVFYKRFSQLITEAIEDFGARRISEAEYLKRMTEARGELVSGGAATMATPASLHGRPEARAFYGILGQRWPAAAALPAQQLAEAGGDIHTILRSLAIRDWQRNEDVAQAMRNRVEDYLLERSAAWNAPLSYDALDAVLEDVIRVAKNVY